jgi:hypothetical protein
LLDCASVSQLTARCPARVARCPRPRHDWTCLIYYSRHPSSRAPHRYSVPQPQAAEQSFKSSAPPRRHCRRFQLVKGKSPQGPMVTVQIEQYLLNSAAQLTSFSSPSATASRLTSRMLPQVSLGASQLLKPRRHHREATAAGIGLEPQAKTNCSDLRRQHREATAASIVPGTLTSSMLPHVSLGASQLLKPASTPPRSYGRRHRSWHYEPQVQTNC